MKKFLLITLVALLVAGCVPYPLYDDGYYYPDYGPYYGYYGPYPHGYAGADVNVFVTGSHGHGLRGGHDFHGGGHGSRGGGSGFHGGAHWGGSRR